jgi:hypothetical protein
VLLTGRRVETIGYAPGESAAPHSSEHEANKVLELRDWREQRPENDGH